MDGLGNINWFGFSPSLNLVDIYEKELNKTTNEEEINILIVGAGDPRHLLHTIAKQCEKKSKKKIKFYVFEKMLELYARDLLLMSIAFEHPSYRGIQEKSELFLDIYGNILNRSFTAQQIQTKANEFIKFITDLENAKKYGLDLFDLNLLKYKERDFLEGIFKFWRLKEDNSDLNKYFPAEKCWDLRLRTHLTTRYDTRSNCYDWDFAMKLADRKNASIIHNKIYAKWRETGIAYELRDTTYNYPNKTLASGMIFNDPRNGDKTSRRGYFGDIVIGPYLSYGIESENLEFYKKANDQYRYTAVDVATSNLNKYLQSIVRSCGFEVEELKLDFEKNLKIEEINEETSIESVKIEEAKEYLEMDDFKITFLPLSSFQDFEQKTKFDSFFDIVYFSNTSSPLFNKNFLKNIKKEALILFETTKYMIELNNEQINAFSSRLKEIASKECGLIDLNTESNDQNKLITSDYLKFKK